MSHSQITKDVNLLTKAFLKNDLEIHSSRCGDFAEGIKMLSGNLELVKVLKNDFISGTYLLEELPVAMKEATNSEKCLKLIVQTNDEMT